MKDFVVYTAIFGNYDKLLEPLRKSSDIDYICFTDDKTLSSNVWNIQVIKPKISSDSCRSARFVKICAHKFLQNYKYSMYVDGNKTIKEVPDILGILDNSKFSIEAHPVRDCIYEEAEACKILNKDSCDILDNQVKIYRKLGFPKHAGLYDSGLHFKEHNDPEIIRLSEQWFGHVRDYSRRDQVSLPFVFKDFPLKLFSSTLRNALVSLHGHKI